MNIAICGTLREDVDQLSQLLRRYMDYVCADAELCVFDSANELLSSCPDSSLALIDADMDGMASVRRFRASRPQCPLIIYSSSRAYAIPCFSLHPVFFLLKPFSKAEFRKAMSLCLSIWVPALHNFSISSGRRAERIRVVEIVYVESFGHTCVLHRSNGSTNINQSLSCLQQQLGETFSRCHKSYLVNLYCVREVFQGELLLSDGSTIPVGAKWADSLSNELSEYQSLYGAFALSSSQ